MSINTVKVTTTNGTLKLTFTNRVSAREFAAQAAELYGDDQVESSHHSIVSYSSHTHALIDLTDFGQPITAAQRGTSEG